MVSAVPEHAQRVIYNSIVVSGNASCGVPEIIVF